MEQPAVARQPPERGTAQKKSRRRAPGLTRRRGRFALPFRLRMADNPSGCGPSPDGIGGGRGESRGEMATMQLEKFSMGVGDRFMNQGEAQLQAFIKARERGIGVVPVWNKSNREHKIVHTEPASVRLEADAATRKLGWMGSYHVDADHINLSTVEPFLSTSDFFTIDVADFIGRPADEAAIDAFVVKHRKYAGGLKIPGIGGFLETSEASTRAVAAKFLFACQEAGRINRRIQEAKEGKCIIEVSMDETDHPQTPAELLFILAALAGEGVPAQTIAPKFTGRFNKGVDYVGDLAQFEKEFEEDLAVIAYAIKEFGLPENLKLSVHSGSDKFSIYAAIRRATQKFDAGLHLKTAGTTWLEEIIGLALAGGEGLDIAREIYARALIRFDELCGPYATVIDIDKSKLPSADDVKGWTGARYADALRHVQTCPDFNPHFRQLLHVGYKVAADMGERYLAALAANKDIIAEGVTENIFDRHMVKIFG
jgi:hypothetical protein